MGDWFRNGVVLASLAALIAALLFTLRSGRRFSRAPGTDRADAIDSTAAAHGRSPRRCPLCGHALERGETVRTAVTTLAAAGLGGRPAEHLVDMFGCRYCDPRGRPQGDAAAVPRYCPVCRQALRPQDHVVARMFDRAGGKSHVHVTGCTQCR